VTAGAILRVMADKWPAVPDGYRYVSMGPMLVGVWVNGELLFAEKPDDVSLSDFLAELAGSQS